MYEIIKLNHKYYNANIQSIRKIIEMFYILVFISSVCVCYTSPIRPAPLQVLKQIAQV